VVLNLWKLEIYQEYATSSLRPQSVIKLPSTAKTLSMALRAFSREPLLHYGLWASCWREFGRSRTVAEGYSVQGFYDLEARQVRHSPEWFLSAVAGIADHSKEFFTLLSREDR
jgi:hypothetical protein